MKKVIKWIKNEGENLYEMLKNFNNTFWWKFWTTLSPNISGPKCLERNCFFLQKVVVNKITVNYKKGTQLVKKSQKQGYNSRTSLPIPNMGETPQGGGGRISSL